MEEQSDGSPQPGTEQVPPLTLPYPPSHATKGGKNWSNITGGQSDNMYKTGIKNADSEILLLEIYSQEDTKEKKKVL